MSKVLKSRANGLYHERDELIELDASWAPNKYQICSYNNEKCTSMSNFLDEELALKYWDKITLTPKPDNVLSK